MGWAAAFYFITKLFKKYKEKKALKKAAAEVQSS